jgi:hypothetical protein
LGEFTVARQSNDAFTYEGARRVEVVVNRQTRDWVRSHGDRLYVWGSDLGYGSIVHADVTPPPDHVRFERLRPLELRPQTFDLFVDDGLAVRGLVIRYRHALRPHFFVRPFWLSQP